MTQQAPQTAWDELNNIQPELTEADRKEIQIRKELQMQIAKDCAETFSTDAGKRTLVWMRNCTIERPTLPASATAGLDGMAIAILQNIREGENNFCRMIEAQIKKGVKPNEPA